MKDFLYSLNLRAISLVVVLVGFAIFNTVVFSYMLDRGLPDYDLGVVTNVVDGDTVHVKMYWRSENKTVRIKGLDAFESKKYKRISKQITPERDVNAVLKLGAKGKSIAKKYLQDQPVVLIFGEHRYGFYGRPLAQVMFVHNGEWTDFKEYVCENYTDYFWKCEELNGETQD
jgi:endonuclease YncB( thermonuclease family)